MNIQELTSKIQQMIITKGIPNPLFEYAEALFSIAALGEKKHVSSEKYKQHLNDKISHRDLIGVLSSFQNSYSICRENPGSFSVFVIHYDIMTDDVCAIAEFEIPYNEIQNPETDGVKNYVKSFNASVSAVAPNLDTFKKVLISQISNNSEKTIHPSL